MVRNMASQENMASATSSGNQTNESANPTMASDEQQQQPKLKGSKRLLQRLQRMSSASSLARFTSSSSPGYRGLGKGSISCISLSSPTGSPYGSELSTANGSNLSNGYSTAPTSVPGTPRVEHHAESTHVKKRFINTHGFGIRPASPSPAQPLPEGKVIISRPGTSTLRTPVVVEESTAGYFPDQAANNTTTTTTPPLTSTTLTTTGVIASQTKPLKRRENFDFWGDMPPELRVQIIKLLDPKDIVRSSAVSKSWHKMCFDGQLWSDLDASDFYRQIPAEGLSKIIQYAGPFIRDLNLRGCVQLWECWRSHGLADVCRHLEHLSLEGCRIDRTCLHSVLYQNPSLLHVNLSGLHCVTNSTMKIIAQYCPKLEFLNISWCSNVEVKGLRKVIESCHNLSDLRAGKVRGFDDIGIMQEMFKANTLERLVLMDCDGVNDESLTTLIEGKDSEVDFLTGRRIVPPRKLKHLDISRCRNITDTGIKALVHNMPDLEGLQLSKCKALTDLSLKLLIPTLPKLTHLDLEELELITNATLQELAKAPCRKILQHLSISYCENLGDMGMLPVVKSCVNLRNLDLDNTRISDLVLAEAAAMVRHRSQGPKRSRYSLKSNAFAHQQQWQAAGGPPKPKVGLRMVVYDCQNVTWTGIREVLSRNAEIRRPTPLSFLLPSSTCSARSRAIQAQESSRTPFISPSSSTHPHQIISLKVFYGYQPTVTEHTRRVLRGDLAAASRLERKWAEYMMASEEAGAAMGVGTGTGIGHGLGQGLIGLGGMANRRRRRRVREAQMMHADEEGGGGGGSAGSGGVGLGRRRRARSGGGCTVM